MSLLKHNSAAAILGLLLSIGMVASAYVIGQAVFAIKATERFVTVKGFAEKEVSDNVVILPIAYTETGDDLVEVQRNLVKDKQAIIAFLKARGFDEDEITSSIPQITDYQAQGRSLNN